MSTLYRLPKIVRSAEARHAFPFVVVTLLFVSTALAAPVTYTGLTITDGQLGSWSFTNARVYLTFQTDTSFVQQTQIAGVNVAYVGPYPPAQLCTGTPTFVGTARVTIISGGREVSATFAPNQIFVSLDKDNGGVGFGSCSANGFEPAYPLGLAGGTIFGTVFQANIFPSPEMAALPIDLTETAGYSGRAWVCVGFPTSGAPCKAPTLLQTDKGVLTLAQPYQAISGNPVSFNDTLSGGIFTAVVGGHRDSDGQSNGFPITSGDAPITYNGVVVADASLGGQSFNGALVYISFQADPHNVVPFSDAISSGFLNTAGKGRVTIVSGRHVVSASFLPGQIYVFLDVKNSSVGFASYASGRGYPLAFTATQPSGSFYGFQSSTLGAVGDILRTAADASKYTPLTATLLTNLTNPTTLSGNASSCGSLDPTTAICSNLTPVPLATSQGSFTITEPYTDDVTGTGTQPYSGNFGIFWSEKRSHTDD